ncbi:class I SAM-dependent methyltransferase [Streptomyces justiciae]|uniref:class I SAM-dependent methyltransferase n=1 Tax=Streptomyces justiciae TaxID=2780140 RepID=UPI0021178E6B|nr:class I SAM-dependent methyltransferase [Streptomyces justiciae]MCW8376412.1 methyltransferase domain-containing protein [Streptomyces justiciae]
MALRETFNEDAELYDRARPAYPPDLVGQLARASGLGPGRRVLEVAPGTGQLTLPLAEFGGQVTAVELGPDMAAVARRRLRDFPQVSVEVADFDDWPLPAEPFDLMVCATAWHWLDPARRVEKAADALAPGGLLGVIVTDHVAGGTTEFFHRSQQCYRRWDPATPPGLLLKEADEIPPPTEEFERCPRFENVAVTRYFQEITYTTDEYLDVLLTYSNHRALDTARREGLLACIRELIDSGYDGRVTKRYLHDLITATRTGSSPVDL